MMKVVKKYLRLSVILMVYVSAVSMLLKQFTLYQTAYRELSRLLSHPTIEVEALYEKRSE